MLGHRSIFQHTNTLILRGLTKALPLQLRCTGNLVPVLAISGAHFFVLVGSRLAERRSADPIFNFVKPSIEAIAFLDLFERRRVGSGMHPSDASTTEDYGGKLLFSG